MLCQREPRETDNDASKNTGTHSQTLCTGKKYSVEKVAKNIWN